MRMQRLVIGLGWLCLAGGAGAMEPGPWRHGGDAEPVDPAEQRPAVQPPVRPAERGSLAWVALGPAPTRSAQVRVPPDNLVCGAIHAIAAHPTNAAILYIGAVNGGIWRTTDATAAQPTWTPLTDDLPSQSIGALAFDPTDTSHQTLIAGTGRWSNFGQRGDDEIGVYRTTDGGASWAMLGASTLMGRKIAAVAARGAILMAASTNGGLFRSIDTGGTWTPVSGTGNLPAGSMPALTGDPSSDARFYAGVLGASPRVLRSTDTGATWTDVTTGITGLSSSTGSFRIAVGPTGVVYVAVINTGVIAGVFRSANQGASWTAMDVPAVHPGSQGTVNTSMVVDPADPDVVYIAGDRITVSPFTGNVRRGDAGLAAGAQFVTIVDGNAGNTAPHADSRAMAFDAAGGLLQSDDGGIYRRANPTSSTGTWSSVIGNLNVMEVHDLAHDRVADIILIGTQDNGTHMQQAATNPVWTLINGGDGGDVAIDDRSLAAAGSFRYISSQNFGGARRARYSAANALVSNTTLPSGVTDPQFVTPIEVNAADAGRVLIGGVNTLYEINNATATPPTLSVIGAPGANRNAMAYGAAGAPDVAYVGRGTQVFRRDGAAFVATGALPAGAAAVTDVALDPNDPDRVFAIDDDQVFRSIDGGATWTDVTGNLTTISGRDFRTIEFIPRGGVDLVAVGTRSGVFFAGAANDTWASLGAGIPDVLVFDLRWIESQNRLIAGTLGRGVWGLTFVLPDPLFQDGFEAIAR
jgi:hypothetical protein